MAVNVAGYMRYVLRTRIKAAKLNIAKKQKLVLSMEKELAKLNKKGKGR